MDSARADTSDSDSDSGSIVDCSHILAEVIQPQKFLRIIGKAGVGKSTYILSNFPKSDYIITSYTGIAAARLGAKTISSLFKLGHAPLHSVGLALKIVYQSKAHYEIRNMKGLVVDEFFTLPADAMLMVDDMLKTIRRDERPFGGMDLILVGDDRQTKCVDANAFIDTPLYRGITFDETVLPNHDNMRLRPQYMLFCDKFRNPKLSAAKIFTLLKDPRFAQAEVRGIYVYHENKHVDKRNVAEMEKFEGEVLGTFDNIEYKKNCPVLILNNTRYCSNGMICKLVAVVKKGSKQWLVLESDADTINAPAAEIKFAPAFSITIHRSQCNTFPGINLYISPKIVARDRPEAIRLIYTALTRVSRFTKCFVGIL